MEAGGNGWFRGRLASAPGVRFYAVLLIPTGAWLWSSSLPGSSMALMIVAGWGLTLGALIWFIRFVLVSRREERPPRWWTPFLVGPVAGVLILVLAFSSVPLLVRWELSKTAFAEEAKIALRTDDYRNLRSHGVGLYRIRTVERHGGDVLFYEQTGDFLDHAGFAYLPGGPTKELERNFEWAEWDHLSGPWYVWTAGW